MYRHRKFIVLSFTNSAFAFTRRTCLAASKTILKEALAETDKNAPVLWIDQAFSVVAGIILSLDTFHRKPTEKEHGEHSQLTANAIDYLKKFEHSRIAKRGVHLLSSLQRELDGSRPLDLRKRTSSMDPTSGNPPCKRRQTFQVQNLIRNVSQNFDSTNVGIESAPEPAYTGIENVWDAFLDLLPPLSGFDGEHLFDGLGAI